MMNEINKSKNNQPPDAEPQEEEIIFPKTDELKPPTGKVRQPFSLVRFLLLLFIVVGVFFAGFFTSPQNFQDTVDQIKEWTSISKEKIKPYMEKWTQVMETKVKQKKPETPAPAEQEQRKVKYWRAPMDPTYIRDKPGKSPMGMDLIPVYEDEADAQITISPTMTQNMGIKTAKVKRRTLRHEIRTVGTLTYDERKVHHIHTKYGGWIEKLHVDFTGQEVKKDDLLMEIYSPDLVSTQEELILAIKYKESLKDSPYSELSQSADSLLETTKKRLKLFDVPDHQIEELMRNKKITKTMHIHSPVRGFVIKKKALEGMHVEPGMSLYSIADLSNIWVLADIYEYELPWIKIGEKAEMNLSYFPGIKFKGKVTFVDPFLDPKTRTLKVRMEFANPNWELKPDMYANVTIQSTVVKRGLTVPEEAVIHSGEKSLVIVAKKSGKYESREVTLGVQAGGYYQIKRGLKKGETVVISSNFLIDSESKLREAINPSAQPSNSPAANRRMGKPPQGP